MPAATNPTAKAPQETEEDILNPNPKHPSTWIFVALTKYKDSKTWIRTHTKIDYLPSIK
jgi:hypothetical protein